MTDTQLAQDVATGGLPARDMHLAEIECLPDDDSFNKTGLRYVHGDDGANYGYVEMMCEKPAACREHYADDFGEYQADLLAELARKDEEWIERFAPGICHHRLSYTPLPVLLELCRRSDYRPELVGKIYTRVLANEEVVDDETLQEIVSHAPPLTWNKGLDCDRRQSVPPVHLHEVTITPRLARFLLDYTPQIISAEADIVRVETQVLDRGAAASEAEFKARIADVILAASDAPFPADPAAALEALGCLILDAQNVIFAAGCRDGTIELSIPNDESGVFHQMTSIIGGPWAAAFIGSLMAADWFALVARWDWLGKRDSSSTA